MIMSYLCRRGRDDGGGDGRGHVDLQRLLGLRRGGVWLFAGRRQLRVHHCQPLLVLQVLPWRQVLHKGIPLFQ